MAKNTSITLSERFETMIQRGIDEGRYASASEVIREGLRLVEEREERLRQLREGVAEGKKSGYIEEFDPQQHLAELKRSNR